MDELRDVGLGFAEFVGQLLCETFDAVLNAQQHQIQRRLELVEALAMSDAAFKARFIGAELVRDREARIFGARLEPGMRLSSAQELALAELSSAPRVDSRAVSEPVPLSVNDVTAARAAIESLLVREQRDQIAGLLHRIQEMHLIVDQGEITAKVELSTVARVGDAPPEMALRSTRTETTSGSSAPRETREAEAEAPGASIRDAAAAALSLGGRIIVDPETKRTTVLFDRQALERAGRTAQDSPLRVTARPITSTSQAMTSSQVTIRFRTA
ncbi:MAG: hypothetical protein IPK80_03950 [Nannocystis sp.]|nr:hypothetical protein [Nannocystis sp.]